MVSEAITYQSSLETSEMSRPKRFTCHDVPDWMIKSDALIALIDTDFEHVVFKNASLELFERTHGTIEKWLHSTTQQSFLEILKQDHTYNASASFDAMPVEYGTTGSEKIKGSYFQLGSDTVLLIDNGSRDALERDFLRQEIEHRVYNNLALIEAIIQFQEIAADKVEVRKQLRRCRERIQHVGLIHQIIYDNPDLKSIRLDSLIRQVSMYDYSLIQDHKANITYDLQPTEVSLNKAVILLVIINELIINALKHARPVDNDLLIHIGLSDQGETYTVNIRDNGIGITAELMRKSTGFTGLRLIEMLKKQLNATISFSCKNGTEVSVVVNKGE